MSGLRARIHAAAGQGPCLVGPFLSIPSPMVAEIACASGPDFVCIDMEHGPISTECAENMLRAAALHGVPALVRVASADAAAIGLALDLGAAGVLVPRISSSDEARRVVGAARFPPEGHRGAGPGRAAGYGRSIGGYLDAARAQTVVAVQIETVEALDALDAILAVEGIDLVFVGPGDLGVGLAAVGRGNELHEATEAIIRAARRAGLPSGLFVMTREDAVPWQDRVALTICGSDTTILIAGFDATFGKVVSPG